MWRDEILEEIWNTLEHSIMTWKPFVMTWGSDKQPVTGKLFLSLFENLDRESNSTMFAIARKL
jgi:hypothetical protein